MTVDKMPADTAATVLNMIAYGCIGPRGFDARSYELLLCRTNQLRPEGEFLDEFRPDADYPVMSGDDIDAAAGFAAKRLCGSN